MAAFETETTLPIPLSTFVGREAELESLRQLLASGARLITLTGPGGVGKTRLALECAALTAADFADGAVFVSLQALTESGEVLSEVANAMGVRESGNRSIIEDLSAALANRHVLICIDNWEHVLEAAPQLAALLMACPYLQVLATSRETLRLQGERQFRVEPFSGPAAQADALELFVARAAAVRRDFILDEASTPVIAAICALLDGLPLAIELAAALMRLFSPQALLARLQRAPGLSGRSPTLQMLAGGPRDLPARQQTLQAAIAWSYGLLAPDEQRLFRWLAVFAGGCDLEAAEAVCGDETASRPILDSLLALVNKNLLRAEQVDGEPRFVFLQTIYQYARERLQESGELQAAHRRHADCFVDLAERASGGFRGPNRAAWLEKLEREHDNFRSVLTWSLVHGQAETAFRLGGAVGLLWAYRGHDREGRQWLTRIAAVNGDVAPSLRAKVLNRAAQFEYQQGDLESAERRFTESLLLTKSVGDKKGMSVALRGFGHVAHLRNDFDSAVSYWRESLALEHEVDPVRVSGTTLQLIATSLCRNKDYKGALRYAEQALTVAQDLGDPTVLAESYLTLGDIVLAQGDYAQAKKYANKGRTLSAELRDVYACAWADQTLGRVALATGHVEEAAQHFRESLKILHDLDDPIGRAESLEGLACVAARCPAPERAAHLWGAAEALRCSLGTRPDESDSRGYERDISAVRAHLKDKAYLKAKQIGAEMDLERAVAYALEPINAELVRSTSRVARGIYPAGLTAREVEVLALVAEGLTDAEVAEKLVLSPRTVNAHLTSIYNKLGVNSRAAATRFAVEQKLV